jgi:hypothetical protein
MDGDIESRVSKVAESILGNEALTGNLNDEAADLFLKWAITKGEAIARSTAGMDEFAAEEVMNPRLKALRHLARYLGNWVTGSGEPWDLVEKIIEQARILYGDTFVEPDPAEKERIARYPLGVEPIFLVAAIKNLFEGEENGKE